MAAGRKGDRLYRQSGRGGAGLLSADERGAAERAGGCVRGAAGRGGLRAAGVCAGQQVAARGQRSHAGNLPRGGGALPRHGAAAKARPGVAAARLGLPLRGRAADPRGADGVCAGRHERGRGAGHDAGAAGAAVVGAVHAVCGCAGRAVRDAALHPGVSGWFPFHRCGGDVRGVRLAPVPDGYGVSPPVRGGGSGAGAGAVRAGGRIEGGCAGGGAAVYLPARGD